MDISSLQNLFFLAFFPASGYFNENILVFIWEVAMEAFNSKMVRRIVGVVSAGYAAAGVCGRGE